MTTRTPVRRYTDFVAPLPLEGHFPESNVHDVVVRLRRVTHLADDVALLHHGVALLLQLANRTSNGFQRTLPSCYV